MRRTMQVASAVLAGLVLAGGVNYAQLVKPVGYVTKDYCTRAEKPCTEYTFTVEKQHATASI